MCHSTKTADMHYDVFAKEVNEVLGAEAIQSLLRGKDSPAKLPRKIWTKEEVSLLKSEAEKGTPLKDIHLEASHRQKYDKIRKCSPELLLTVSLFLFLASPQFRIIFILFTIFKIVLQLFCYFHLLCFYVNIVFPHISGNKTLIDY